jgi:hypothetical protein
MGGCMCEIRDRVMVFVGLFAFIGTCVGKVNTSRGELYRVTLDNGDATLLVCADGIRKLNSATAESNA